MKLIIAIVKPFKLDEVVEVRALDLRAALRTSPPVFNRSVRRSMIAL